MSFVMAYYLATFGVLLIMHETISPVKGQSTVQGCDNGDPLTSIVSEIQQLRVELFDQLNKQVQSIHELLNASFQEKESQQGIVNMRLKDRCPDEHNIYIKQGQRIHELLNESFQELTSQHGTIMTSLLAWKLANGICGPASEVCDCSDIKASGQNASGVYEVCAGYQTDRFCTYAFCDMETANGTSLVFQRRKDGSVNFYRTWTEYKQGFGDRNGEFWLGNEMLYLLTSKRNYKLRIDLEDFEGNKRFAEYGRFSISSSVYNYTLEVGGYSGDADDSLTKHNGRQFSTKDADNDTSNTTSCAQYFRGAWWYHSCYRSNLNGIYHRGNYSDPSNSGGGIVWSGWLGLLYSLKSTEMKLVPVA